MRVSVVVVRIDWNEANSKEIYMQWKWKPLWWIYVGFDSRIHTANANACSRVWLWFDLDALGCWVFVYLWHIFSCCLASISFLVRSAASICVHCYIQPICAETIRAEKKKNEWNINNDFNKEKNVIECWSLFQWIRSNDNQNAFECILKECWKTFNSQKCVSFETDIFKAMILI